MACPGAVSAGAPLVHCSTPTRWVDSILMLAVDDYLEDREARRSADRLKHLDPFGLDS